MFGMLMDPGLMYGLGRLVSLEDMQAQVVREVKELERYAETLRDDARLEAVVQDHFALLEGLSLEELADVLPMIFPETEYSQESVTLNFTPEAIKTSPLGLHLERGLFSMHFYDDCHDSGGICNGHIKGTFSSALFLANRKNKKEWRRDKLADLTAQLNQFRVIEGFLKSLVRLEDPRLEYDSTINRGFAYIFYSLKHQAKDATAEQSNK